MLSAIWGFKVVPRTVGAKNVKTRNSRFYLGIVGKVWDEVYAALQTSIPHFFP